jgi:hypothetical protein
MWELLRYTKENRIVNNVGMKRWDLNKRWKGWVLGERENRNLFY